MSISGNQETGGRPLSTADLAAAGRRPDSAVDENEQPVLNRERVPSTDREERIRGRQEADRERQEQIRSQSAESQSTDASEAQQRATAAEGDARSRGRSATADTSARSSEALEPLFTPELAETYRARWMSIQSGFVDDPRQTVRSGDELVAQMMTNLANTFAEERHRVEAQLDETAESSTENLRVTLRRYRSFFERLLSL